MKTLLGFCHLAIIFKVTVELNRSNFSVYGGGQYFSLKTFLVIFLPVTVYSSAPCLDPENSVRGPNKVFKSSTSFAEGRTDLPRETIGPIASRGGFCSRIFEETYSHFSNALDFVMRRLIG